MSIHFLFLPTVAVPDLFFFLFFFWQQVNRNDFLYVISGQGSLIKESCPSYVETMR